MNDFSDKEYHNLRQDTAEVRNCITKYLGYIIGIIGFSGIVKYVYTKDAKLIHNLLLIVITLVVITLLFEVIWYKFKSHNRLVGYMQLIIQELGAIPKKIISKEDLKSKHYIKDQKEYLDQHFTKGLNDLFSWELMMSRLNNNYHTKRDNEADVLKSIKRSQFIFSLPEQNVVDPGHPAHDVDFFKKIILKLYGKGYTWSELKGKDKIVWLLFPIWSLIGSWVFLFHNRSKSTLKLLRIDKRYVISGWKYPKQITQIAFIAVSTLFTIFLILFNNNYVPSTQFSPSYSSLKEWSLFDPVLSEVPIQDILVFMLGVLAYLVYLKWITKYVYRLKELVHGRESIDAYCWRFFIYRIQLLNSKGLIPIFYSRAYLRYLKSLEILVYVKNNRSDFESGLNKNDLDHYIQKLDNFERFSKKECAIHSKVKGKFEREYPNKASVLDN